MLRVAGRIRHACEFELFDFLVAQRRDGWGRGRFPWQLAPKPAVFGDLARKFRRFGRARDEFRAFLRERRYEAVLIQTGMTYWYLGLKEVIEDVRTFLPHALIVLGGVYATLCPGHARTLEADLVIEGDDLDPLWKFIPEPLAGVPYHDASRGDVAAMRLTDGCPFRCSYCSVPLKTPQFACRETEECLEEARTLVRAGVRHVAFYDDALLFKPEEALAPFLQGVIREQLPLSFHTPNALNVRLMTPEIAGLMVRAGVRSFFLGFESGDAAWLQNTGGKASVDEFSKVVSVLRDAGATSITAYIIIGHPDDDSQRVEDAMRIAHQHGVRILLSEFSPIPGTADGERCRAWTDLDEPLCHNKTAFTLRRLGAQRVRRLKDLCREINGSLAHQIPR